MLAVELGDDDVMRISFARGAVLDGATMRVAMSLQVELSRGLAWPVLVELEGLKVIAREARALVTGTDAVAATSRAALLVGGPLSAMIGNFLARVTRPPFPLRVFTDRAEALAWLAESRAVAAPRVGA